MADSLDMDVLFRQSRYEQDAPGDYLNAPFDKESYDASLRSSLPLIALLSATSKRKTCSSVPAY